MPGALARVFWLGSPELANPETAPHCSITIKYPGQGARLHVVRCRPKASLHGSIQCLALAAPSLAMVGFRLLLSGPEPVCCYPRAATGDVLWFTSPDRVWLCFRDWCVNNQILAVPGESARAE